MAKLGRIQIRSIEIIKLYVRMDLGYIVQKMSIPTLSSEMSVHMYYSHLQRYLERMKPAKFHKR